MPTDEPYYEVEIKPTPVGLMSGEVYLVKGDRREKIGDTRQPLGGMHASRDSVIRAARTIAKRHRDGADVVRLDLDAEDAADE